MPETYTEGPGPSPVTPAYAPRPSTVIMPTGWAGSSVLPAAIGAAAAAIPAPVKINIRRVSTAGDFVGQRPTTTQEAEEYYTAVARRLRERGVENRRDVAEGLKRTAKALESVYEAKLARDYPNKYVLTPAQGVYGARATLIKKPPEPGFFESLFRVSEPSTGNFVRVGDPEESIKQFMNDAMESLGFLTQIATEEDAKEWERMEKLITEQEKKVIEQARLQAAGKKRLETLRSAAQEYVASKHEPNFFASVMESLGFAKR